MSLDLELAGFCRFALNFFHSEEKVFRPILRISKKLKLNPLVRIFHFWHNDCFIELPSLRVG